jgi:hypothetical protein
VHTHSLTEVHKGWHARSSRHASPTHSLSRLTQAHSLETNLSRFGDLRIVSTPVVTTPVGPRIAGEWNRVVGDKLGPKQPIEERALERKVRLGRWKHTCGVQAVVSLVSVALVDLAQPAVQTTQGTRNSQREKQTTNIGARNSQRERRAPCWRAGAPPSVTRTYPHTHSTRAPHKASLCTAHTGGHEKENRRSARNTHPPTHTHPHTVLETHNEYAAKYMLPP